MASEQGVRQDCPSDVRASAPAGSDSNCMLTVVGVGFMKLGVSSDIQPGIPEHAARLKPQAAIAMTRFMIDTVPSIGSTATLQPAGAQCEAFKHAPLRARSNAADSGRTSSMHNLW